MRLLTEGLATRRDRRVAAAWPGPWTGITITATRVTTTEAGRACARRLAEEAKALCSFPVLVIYDPPPDVHEVVAQDTIVYDAPQHVVCMWPADSDPHRLLEVLLPTLEEPTSEYAFIHHFFEYTTWDRGLEELPYARHRQSEFHRVNWR